MITKIIIILALTFLFIAETFAQDTLKIAIDSVSISQDSIIEETPIISYSYADKECKCDYLKILPENVPKYLYEKDIDIVIWTYKQLYHYSITPEKDTVARPIMYGVIGQFKKDKFFYGGSITDTITEGKENVKLSTKQKKQLFKLLHAYRVDFNNCFIGTSENMCYRPRHVILFYQQNKVIDFLEVCFECSRFMSSNKAFDDVFQCYEKYNLLKVLFKKIGIKQYLDRDNIMPKTELRKRK